MIAPTTTRGHHVLVRIWFKRRDGTRFEGPPQELRLNTTKDISVTNGYDGWTYLMLGQGRKMQAVLKYHASLKDWEIVAADMPQMRER